MISQSAEGCHAYSLVVKCLLTLVICCPLILFSQPQKLKHFKTFNASYYDAFRPIEYHDALYFFADDSVGGKGLWRTDGTEVGTKLFLKHDFVARLTPVNNKLYFLADNKIWETDGTETGTRVSVDFPGIDKFWIADSCIFFTTVSGTRYENYVYINAYSRNMNGDITLLKANLKQDLDYYKGYEAVFVRDGKLYMCDWDRTLFGSDGTSVNKLPTLFYTGLEITFDDFSIFYRREDPSIRVFKNTSQYDIAVNHIPLDYHGVIISIYPKKIDGYFYFTVNNNVDNHKGGELWRSDGTVNGTTLVRKFDYGVNILGSANGIIFCTHELAYGNVEIALFQGGALIDLYPQFLGHIDTNNILETADYIYFNNDISGLIHNDSGLKRFNPKTKSLSKLYNDDLLAVHPKFVNNHIVFFEQILTIHQRNLYTIEDIKKDQTIDFTLPKSIKVTDSPLILSASATSNLPITYTLLNSGGHDLTIKNDTLLFSHVPKITNSSYPPLIMASQAGNENYYPAYDIFRELKIECMPAELAFDSIPNKNLGDAPFKIHVDNKPDLPVSFRVEASHFDGVYGKQLGVWFENCVSVTPWPTFPPDIDPQLKIVHPGRVVIEALVLDDVYCPSSVFQSFCIYPEKPKLEFVRLGGMTFLSVTSSYDSAFHPGYQPDYHWTFNDSPMSTNARLIQPNEGVFKASVSIDDCESPYSEPFVIDDQVYFYPNPVKNEIFISNRSSNNYDLHDIQIIDAKGMLIYTKACESNPTESVKVDQLSLGLYVLKMIGKKTVTLKFIKE